MGDHTDYAGGLCLPVAIDLRTEVSVTPDRSRSITLESEQEGSRAAVPIGADLGAIDSVQPEWARYVASVVALVAPAAGMSGTVRSAIPARAGLASSAALEVATALALGFDGGMVELATTCQRAEQAAVGVPCGLMDQLVAAMGVEGHALLLDMSGGSRPPVAGLVRVPPEIDIAVVHSGTERRLSSSSYADRRMQCEAAAAIVGPLADARTEDLGTIADPLLRRRARHVITETARVKEMVSSLACSDLACLGEIMRSSQASLSADCEVSTPELDELARAVSAVPGVIGARITGAGFGGCLVVLAEAGALAKARLPKPHRVLEAGAGAVVSQTLPAS